MAAVLGDDVIDIALRLLRQLADVNFPASTKVPGSGPARAGALTLGDPRVTAVLQGTDFIRPDSTLSDVTVSGNDQAFLTTFPFLAPPNPLPGDAWDHSLPHAEPHPATACSINIQMKLWFSVLLPGGGGLCAGPRHHHRCHTDQQITLYQSWVAKDPSSISNRTLLAGAYIQKTRETTDFGYLDRASKILEGVLSEHQDYEALRLRNIVELTLHHFSKAAEYARAMTERWPGDVQSWGTLGDARLEMGQYEAAHDAFAKMLELKPGLMSYNRMGFFRFITGDPEAGIELMKKAVDAAAKYPENKAWCLVELGNMYFKTGRMAGG